MQLESETGAPIISPTGADIERAIGSLDSEHNTFAILTQEPSTYMQTRISDDGYELEYQAGHIEQHYEATRLMTLDETIEAFTRYAAEDPAWKTDIQWQHLDLSNTAKGGCAGMVLLVLCLAWIVIR